MTPVVAAATTTGTLPGLSTRLQIYEEREPPLRRLYSTEMGVIKEVYELKVQASELPFFVYAARCGPNLMLTGAHRPTVTGSGAALTRSAAHDAAIGEAIERYCATYLDPETIVEAPRAQLVEPSIDPATLARYSEAQYSAPKFGMHRFTESTCVAWTLMQRFRDGTELRVPVHCAYLGYHRKKHVAEIGQLVSTGLACAADPAVAILKGLYEAVERDAFNITWLNRLAMPRLDVTGTSDPTLTQMLALFERARLTPSFMLLTLDIPIPIVLCMLRDETGARPALAAGAAANLDPVRAAAKAAVEVAHTRLWVSGLGPTKGKKTFSADFREVENFDDHVWLFDAPEMVRHAEFLWSSPTVVRVASLPNGCSGDDRRDLDVACQRVEQAGFDVLHKDMTTPDIAECGLFVYRAFVPGLQNINGPHKYRLLGGRRLYDVPVQLGLLKRPHHEADLNPIPHPFP